MSLSRNFFERFEYLIHNYTHREGCQAPVVEFFLHDNTKFEIKNIVAIGDSWLEFTIYDKTGCSTDVILPFEQIAKVIMYRDPQKSQTIGFKS